MLTDRKSIGWPSMDDQIHVQKPKLILGTNILLEHRHQRYLNPVRHHSHLRRLKMGLFEFYSSYYMNHIRYKLYRIAYIVHRQSIDSSYHMSHHMSHMSHHMSHMGLIDGSFE